VSRVYLLSSTEGTYYISLFCGVVFVVLFLLWAIWLLNIVTHGKENTNLQKMYGHEAEKKKGNDKKKELLCLVLSGILLFCLATLYYMLL